MELFFEILIKRFIVRTFGYYTLLIYFKAFKNKKGVKWLKKTLDNEGEEFGKGIIIGIVGLLSFAGVVMMLLYIADFLFY